MSDTLEALSARFKEGDRRRHSDYEPVGTACATFERRRQRPLDAYNPAIDRLRAGDLQAGKSIERPL
jgi:hypothetical protein